MAKKRAPAPPSGPKRTQRMLTVSEARYAALEEIARTRRRKTGEAITWQDIANEGIDEKIIG